MSQIYLFIGGIGNGTSVHLLFTFALGFADRLVNQSIRLFFLVGEKRPGIVDELVLSVVLSVGLLCCIEVGCGCYDWG